MAGAAEESRIYPLNEAQPYPFEQWWIAAYSHEVSRSLIQRTILGQSMVFYRTESGEPVPWLACVRIDSIRSSKAF